MNNLTRTQRIGMFSLLFVCVALATVVGLLLTTRADPVVVTQADPIDSNVSTTVVTTTTSTSATLTSSASPATSDPADELGQVVVDYIEALGTREAEALAEPGSPAADFAYYLGAASGSADAVSSTTYRATLRRDGTVSVSGGTALNDIIDNIEVSDEKVRSFTLDEIPVGEVIYRVDPSGVNGFAVLDGAAARSNSANGAVVLLEVENTSGVTANALGFDTSLVAADGRQIEVTDTSGPFDIRPGARTTLGFVFTGGEPAGATMYWTVGLENASYDIFDLAITIAGPRVDS